MMPSERFKPVQRVVDSRERKAARALGDTLKTRQQAEQRLADLHSYHAEYLEQYNAANQSGMSVSRMREYQVFLDKLETAISEQKRIVQRASKACDQAQLQWRDKYTRTQVMTNVVDRMKADEQREADRRAQAQADDRPLRRLE